MKGGQKGKVNKKERLETWNEVGIFDAFLTTKTCPIINIKLLQRNLESLKDLPACKEECFTISEKGKKRGNQKKR